ncbi:MAG: histidinol dehydrogenase [Bacteroidia bacterium]|nr:histidinol dehydrogenase [Bacteroidia bacterium]
MKIIRFPKKDTWETLLARPLLDFSQGEARVRDVLSHIKQKGDLALKEYSRKFDGYEAENFRVSEAEILAANTLVPEKLKTAITQAAANIQSFHQSQQELPRRIETMPGVICWRKSVPVSTVGLYIPGGTAPLFSTLLMLAIPAQLAGCRKIVLCTPPGKAGIISPAILYTAGFLGLNEIYKIGGAQAIGAMAYGTASIPRVNKIFGPGNQYVTLAKQQVSQQGVAIDLPAGPSEVAVVADRTANPAFIAADLLSQAEHGTDSQVIFVTDCEPLLEAVREEVEDQLASLPRKEIAREALQHSLIILLENKMQILEMINSYAPEHLILAVQNPEEWAEKIENAGSVFLGHYTPESAGDYASGTNHTLPTNGYAKAYSGVSLDSFVKKITFQQITGEGLRRLGPSVEVMAEAEDLFAHRNAVSIRLETLNGKNHE